VTAFENSLDSPAYTLLLEALASELADYDSVISTPISDIAGIVRQQQAIGARTALSDFLNNHKTRIIQK
jgi:hypothetical protein